jgi:membrane fusion protein (multidrug efflux system)
MKPHYRHYAGLFAATLLLAACGKNTEEGSGANPKRATADTSAVVRVVTDVVKAGTFEDWGEYAADLRGADDAVLTAPAPSGGRVAKVSKVGITVKKGQALCDIDSELYQAQFRQAESAVELAKGELDRAKNNVSEGYVGKAVLDKAQLDYQAARVALLQARRAYEDSRCQAPFAGVLVSRSIEEFQSVPPGSPTMRIAALGNLEAIASIPEREAHGLREGQKARFHLLQPDAAPREGRVTSLDRAVQAPNRVVTARIALTNPEGTLRPGMIGRVSILRARHDKAIVIASQSVLRLQGGTVVMRVRDGRAESVPVKLGPARGDSVVVTSGLSANDRIITVGAFQVSDGTKVSY